MTDKETIIMFQKIFLIIVIVLCCIGGIVAYSSIRQTEIDERRAVHERHRAAEDIDGSPVTQEWTSEGKKRLNDA